LAELAQHFIIHPNQIPDRKTKLLERVAQVLDSSKPGSRPYLKKLHSKIRKLTLENDLLEGALIQVGRQSARFR
jgi:hypothetical protein